MRAFVVTWIVTISLLTTLMILDSVAFSTLWGWFVTPTFDVPALGYARAGGLVLLLRLIMPPLFLAKAPKAVAGDGDEKRLSDKVIDMFRDVGRRMTQIGWYLVVGYIVRQFL